MVEEQRLTGQHRKASGIHRQVYSLKRELQAGQKHREAAQPKKQVLEAKLERLSRAFYDNPAPQAMIACRDERFLDVNAGFERLTGYKREEIVGCTVSELKVKVFVKSKQLQVWQPLRECGEFTDIEYEFRARSGDVKVALGSGVIIQDDDQSYLLFSSWDITEIRRMARMKACQERMNLAGEIAAGIAHEIRNPMAAVRGFLQLLQIKDECAAHKRYFDIMISEMDQANAVITEFLSVANNNQIELKLQDLNGIMRSLLPLIRGDAIKRGHGVTCNLGTIPELYMDEKQIGQLVLNLIRNSLDAMTAPGTLAVMTYLDRGQVILSISDQGTGIEPRVLERLGTPFLTTKERGIGLGLTVCYRIAEQHNADLEVETGSGGTTVKVVFRVDRATAAVIG